MRESAGDTSATWPPSVQAIERAQAGDSEALADILRSGHPRLVAYFAGSGPQRADAEDLAAHTLEAVVTSIHKLKNPLAFEGWFWQIARYSFRGWIRRTRRPARFEPSYTPGADPEDAVHLSDEHAQIRTALEALSPKDRSLLWLRDVEELSYEEIGGRVGSTVGTVRVAYHRARKRLEETYGALEQDD
ncbi:MAG: sigma-70 family RNA polymerase sigma factor [Acidimicrobiia bacterium]|nr:sigma-70 family RNA polymerase sigma factor [Acidimicrobiia bacterium]